MDRVGAAAGVAPSADAKAAQLCLVADHVDLADQAVEKRFEFWIAMAALLGVLSAGVLLGVVIGIVLSLGWLVYVSTRPSMPLLGREAGTQVFRDLEEHPDDESHPDIAVLRVDGGLFFATAEALDERIRAVTDGQPGLRTLVIDLEGRTPVSVGDRVLAPARQRLGLS